MLMLQDKQEHKSNENDCYSESESEDDFRLLIKKHLKQSIIRSDESSSDSEFEEKKKVTAGPEQKRKQHSSKDESRKKKLKRTDVCEKMEETTEDENEAKKENISPPTFPVKNDVKKKSTATEINSSKEKKLQKVPAENINEEKKSLTQKAEERKRKKVQEAVLFEQSKDCLDSSISDNKGSQLQALKGELDTLRTDFKNSFMEVNEKLLENFVACKSCTKNLYRTSKGISNTGLTQANSQLIPCFSAVSTPIQQSLQRSVLKSISSSQQESNSTPPIESTSTNYQNEAATITNNKSTDVADQSLTPDNLAHGERTKLLIGAAKHGVYVDQKVYEDRVSTCQNEETYCSRLFELVFRREDAKASTVAGEGKNPKTGVAYLKLDENRMAAIRSQAVTKFADKIQWKVIEQKFDTKCRMIRCNRLKSWLGESIN